MHRPQINIIKNKISPAHDIIPYNPITGKEDESYSVNFLRKNKNKNISVVDQLTIREINMIISRIKLNNPYWRPVSLKECITGLSDKVRSKDL